jgi:hypothetical protein
MDFSINLLSLPFRRGFSGIISNKSESLNPRMCGRDSEVKRGGRTWTKTFNLDMRLVVIALISLC